MDFREENHENFYKQLYKTTAKLHEVQSPFQKIEVYHSDFFGNILVIDGFNMLCERDEFIYHEMMAHVAKSVNHNIKQVLIIGGGDGGVARELLKYKDIEVTLVDIDAEVVKASQKFFPCFNSVWDHPRFQLHIADGIAFVKQAASKSYDLIIVDSTDPIGPGEGLFNASFYSEVARILSDDGICISQSESQIFDLPLHKAILETIGKFFAIIMPYRYEYLAYPGVIWSFSFASKQLHPLKDLNIQKLPQDLKYYNEAIHKASFALPNYLSKELERLVKST